MTKRVGKTITLSAATTANMGDGANGVVLTFKPTLTFRATEIQLAGSAANLAKVALGQAVAGTGVALGATIKSVDAVNDKITLDRGNTASLSSTTLTLTTTTDAYDSTADRKSVV